MIAIENGYYGFDDFQLAMNFALPAGGIIAVLGASGAGKSTLLNIIAGFENLSRGRVLIDGVDVTPLPPSKRPISFVFQDNNSFAHLTARENVALGVAPSLRLSAAQWSEVDEALARLSIGHMAHRKPGDMSGGERQRIALARVLVRKSSIVLLDEAFAALGPALRQEMLLLMQDLHQRHAMTVMMVTHQPQDAKLIADQVLFIADGLVRNPMAIADFFASRDAAVEHYLGEVSDLPA